MVGHLRDFTVKYKKHHSITGALNPDHARVVATQYFKTAASWQIEVGVKEASQFGEAALVDALIPKIKGFTSKKLFKIIESALKGKQNDLAIFLFSRDEPVLSNSQKKALFKTALINKCYDFQRVICQDPAITAEHKVQELGLLDKADYIAPVILLADIRITRAQINAVFQHAFTSSVHGVLNALVDKGIGMIRTRHVYSLAAISGWISIVAKLSSHQFIVQQHRFEAFKEAAKHGQMHIIYYFLKNFSFTTEQKSTLAQLAQQNNQPIAQKILEGVLHTSIIMDVLCSVATATPRQEDVENAHEIVDSIYLSILKRREDMFGINVHDPITADDRLLYSRILRTIDTISKDGPLGCFSKLHLRHTSYAAPLEVLKIMHEWKDTAPPLLQNVAIALDDMIKYYGHYKYKIGDTLFWSATRKNGLFNRLYTGNLIHIDTTVTPLAEGLASLVLEQGVYASTSASITIGSRPPLPSEIALKPCELLKPATYGVKKNANLHAEIAEGLYY